MPLADSSLNKHVPHPFLCANTGVQKEPLGSVHDFSTQAYNAAQAASSARASEDAYEKAAARAAEEAAMLDQSGGWRMRWGQVELCACVKLESDRPTLKCKHFSCLSIPVRKANSHDVTLSLLHAETLPTWRGGGIRQRTS